MEDLAHCICGGKSLALSCMLVASCNVVIQVVPQKSASFMLNSKAPAPALNSFGAKGNLIGSAVLM